MARSLLHRLALCYLTSFYASCYALPCALMIWVLGNTSTPSALAQSSLQLPAYPDQSAASQILDQAKQRLIERGELTDPTHPDHQPADAFSRYHLGAGDSIYTSVLRFPDLSFQGTLDQQGNLLVPLVGVLPLNGLTVEQARERIRVALDRYVINPQVDVILIAQRPVQVTILGEVFKPGLYPLQAPQLASALVAAGGTTGHADLRTVQIRRSLPNGSVIERGVDLFTPLRESQPIPDFRLEDGDTIVVSALSANSTDYDPNLVARSTLAQPQIYVRVLNYASGRGGSVGRILLPNGSTFTDALTSISPDLGNADIRNIALVRFDVQQGKAVSQELDGKKALLGDVSQDRLLQNNDVLVIGRTFIARLTNALNTFTQPFRDVLGFLLFFDSLTNSADNLFSPGSSNSR